MRFGLLCIYINTSLPWATNESRQIKQRASLNRVGQIKLRFMWCVQRYSATVRRSFTQQYKHNLVLANDRNTGMFLYTPHTVCYVVIESNYCTLRSLECMVIWLSSSCRTVRSIYRRAAQSNALRCIAAYSKCVFNGRLITTSFFVPTRRRRLLVEYILPLHRRPGGFEFALISGRQSNVARQRMSIFAQQTKTKNGKERLRLCYRLVVYIIDCGNIYWNTLNSKSC